MCYISLLLQNVRSIPFSAEFSLTSRRLEDVKLNGATSEAQAASYDRDHARYPYKSHGQWLKAAYGLSACVILVVFNGLRVFLERPFGTREFVASYISVSYSQLKLEIDHC
jgi:hypothetical protein